MNKKHYSEKYRYLFKLPNNAKFVFFRHPKEFSRIDLEKINPNHKIIMWGLLRKKYAKCKPVYKIMMGKINIPCIMTLSFTIDSFILHDKMPVFSMYAIFSIVYVYFSIYYPLRRYNVNWNTRRSWDRKNLSAN